jgi:hypothetical protein
MKAALVPAILVLLLAGSASTLGHTVYTIVPAGAAGPGIYLDKVGPELEGSETLPIEQRLPRIARQPLWASYDIGEPITGAVHIYDEDGRIVRSTSIIVELYRLTFTDPKTYYERIYRDPRVRCDKTGAYRFSVPTDELEPAFYQLRLGLPNGSDLDPEFRVRVGDAEFKIEEPPEGAKGCGCG